MGAPLLLLRADAGPGIGNGHVVRSLALAQAWIARSGAARLATSSLPKELREQVERSGLLVDLVPAHPEALPAYLDDLGPAWVVFDGYHLGVEHHRAARSRVRRIAVIDDHASVGSYDADLIVDQNLGAQHASYRQVADGTRLLLGSRFVMLRREFVARSSARAERAPELADRILVSLGGAPPDQVRQRVLAAVEAADLGPGVTVLAGGAPVRDMPGLLSGIDLALSAAGSIVWELCFAGVPMLLLPIADNQLPLAARLEETGACVALAPDASTEHIAREVRRLVGDRSLRERLSDRARLVVDGLGARRVAAAMRGELLDVREAGEQDAAELYGWASDPTVRAASFHSRPIAWADHRQWVVRRVADPSTRILIVGDDAGAIGQFRAQREERGASVSVSIAEGRRGEGLAPALIDRCSQAILGAGWAEQLHAWIRPENLASQRSFEVAGYSRLEPGVVEGVPALHYARQRDDSF